MAQFSGAEPQIVILAQVGKVHALQAAQRCTFGEIQRSVRCHVEHRVDLIEPCNTLLKREQFRLRGRRDDDVEVQVVEARRVAFWCAPRKVAHVL